MDYKRYGGNNMGIKSLLKSNFWIYKIYDTVRYELPYYIWGEKWSIFKIKSKFKKVFGYELDLNNPKTLNEKIQWLKINEHKEFHTICADKLSAREYWKKFGEDHLIPLLFWTYNWEDIIDENISEVPCIVKCNTGCGCYEIIRNKEDVNFKNLRQKCRKWLSGNYYYRSQEWQYKNIKPCIIVERLLLDANGHIPNDYKLHFINGELQFIYCSVDREGENYRCIYSPDWTRLNIEWVEPKKHTGLSGKDIDCPKTFPQMISIGQKIAHDFKYVRVDFYDVDGKLYYGEITLHHGSGFDTFVPESYDLYYGNKLQL